MSQIITEEMIREYVSFLKDSEKSEATVEKYEKAVRRFNENLNGNSAVTKAEAVAWKNSLAKTKAISTVNIQIAALNSFFKYHGWSDCVLKPFRIQKKTFSTPDRELTKTEYQTLVRTAEEQGKKKISLLLQLLATTGMRVSEVQYVTIDCLNREKVEINLKGKVRTILLPDKMCRKLRQYCKKEGIKAGEVFLTRTGKAMTRKEIWAHFKRLCKGAGVSEKKVFPHNLRRLFARTFYQVKSDIVKLADLLGHSSIETTRIYLMTSGMEHRRLIEKLRLIC